MDENLPLISFGVIQTAETNQPYKGQPSLPVRLIPLAHFPGGGLVGLSPPTCNVTFGIGVKGIDESKVRLPARCRKYITPIHLFKVRIAGLQVFL